jgi:superfamily II DNA or RNA helicase
MYIDTANKRLILKTSKYDAIAALAPEATKLADNIVALPHTDYSVKILQHLGAKVEGIEPIHHYWAWPSLGGEYQLRDDQKTVAAFLTRHNRGYCLNPPRMGKTASTLCALLWQLDSKQVDAVLVVCPLSAVGDWRRELFALRPNETPMFLHGKNRGMLKKGADNRVFIINPDGLKAIAKDIIEAVKAGQIGTVVFDELTEYATKTTQRWKAAFAVAAVAKHVYGLTGTPGSALQTFGQMSLINPHAHLPRSFKHWRDTVAINTFGLKWVERADAKDVVNCMMQPAIRFRKEDVIKLAQPQIEFIDADMSAEQETAYRTLKAKQRMSMPEGTITAVNAGVLVSKLLQVSAGCVRGDDGTVTQFDITPRIDALEHIITHKSESKVVIFASFRAAMQRMADELEKRGITCAQMHGDVSVADRIDIVNRFTVEETPHVLIAHPTTARYSLELSVADTIVFYGPTMQGAYTYHQACNRILSPRQKSLTPAIVHLQSSYAERALHKAVRDSDDANTALVNLFNTEMDL